MKTQGKYCFTHSSGEEIYLYVLLNAKGTEITISNYGAIISSWKSRDSTGAVNDIVLGFDDMEDYMSEVYLGSYPWFGCAIGRYANRIKNASFSVDGKEYHVTANRDDDQLHGGHHGFDRKVWKLLSSGTFPNSFILLRYSSANGEEGYPGNLEVLLRFELNEDDELSYEFTATSDRPTPINLTHHSYFNLNNGKGTIHDHEIAIHASHILGQDEKLVADGNLIPVENTPFDLRRFSKTGEGLKDIGEYDNSFVVNGREVHPMNESAVLVAQARSAVTNAHLMIYSTEPIVHFYSGKWTPVIKGKNGNVYGPFSGFCFETHYHPNAINIPHFPSTILRPGETYRHKTIYKLIVS